VDRPSPRPIPQRGLSIDANSLHQPMSVYTRTNSTIDAIVSLLAKKTESPGEAMGTEALPLRTLSAEAMTPAALTVFADGTGDARSRASSAACSHSRARASDFVSARP
jgi:hypothetical protein